MNIIQNNDLWQRNVEVLPYIQAFPELAENSMFNEKSVVISSEHDKLFGVHSSKQFIIKHLEALQVVNDSVSNMFNAEPEIQVTSVKDGAKIMAKVSLDAFNEITLAGNDTSKIQLILSNNYAKPSDFKLKLGAYRLVCSNGMVVGNTVAGFNSRQLLDEGFNETSLQSKVARMIDEAKFLYDLWSEWSGISLTHDDTLQLFDKKFSQTKLEEILNQTLFPRSMWDVYNDFTAYSTHRSKTASAQMASDDLIASLFYGNKSPLRELDASAFSALSEAKQAFEDAEIVEA